MLLEALLIQQQKKKNQNQEQPIICTGTEFNVFTIPKSQEAYLSNISVTQGFHSPQLRTQKPDSMRTPRETHNYYASSNKQAHQAQTASSSMKPRRTWTTSGPTASKGDQQNKPPLQKQNHFAVQPYYTGLH